LTFLGDFFLGLGLGESREKASENWWDREVPLEPAEEAGQPLFGRQTELFDETGRVVVAQPEGRGAPSASSPQSLGGAQAVPQTLVSVRSRSASGLRVVTTTRSAAPVRVTVVPKTAEAQRGAVARQLVASQSISSGKEESRWFSVPQRVLLPRYQLFEGSDAVREDSCGGLSLVSRSMRTQRGQVWFV
jgi:hypothetical protein